MTGNAVAKVSYTHDAMIDLIIAEPSITKTALAKTFGYTVGWVSQITNSDAFQARLAERKAELVDPSITLTVEEKFMAIAQVSADKVLEKLSAPLVDIDVALESLELSSKALGYGARSAGNNQPQVQNNFVVALPERSNSTEEWGEKYANGIQPTVIEAEIEVETVNDAALPFKKL